MTDILSFDVEVGSPAPVCDEPGRVGRAYVSGYQRARNHNARIVRGEKSCLVAEFRGCYPGHALASCLWQTNDNWLLTMSNPRIVGTEADIDLLAQYSGVGWVKVSATFENGDCRVQLFRVAVESGGWYIGESYYAPGPQVLTATVPPPT